MNGKKVRLIKHAQIEHQLPPYLGNHYFYLMTRSELPIGSSHQFVTSSNINNTRQQISQTVKQFPLTTPVLRSGITCTSIPGTVRKQAHPRCQTVQQPSGKLYELSPAKNTSQIRGTSSAINDSPHRQAPHTDSLFDQNAKRLMVARAMLEREEFLESDVPLRGQKISRVAAIVSAKMEVLSAVSSDALAEV